MELVAGEAVDVEATGESVLSVPITMLNDGSVGCTQMALSSAASPLEWTGAVSTMALT